MDQNEEAAISESVRTSRGARSAPASVMGIVVTSLKADDLQALLKDNPHLLAATGYVKGAETISWGDQKIDTSFTGVSAQYIDVEDAKVAAGRLPANEALRYLVN